MTVIGKGIERQIGQRQPVNVVAIILLVGKQDTSRINALSRKRRFKIDLAKASGHRIHNRLSGAARKTLAHKASVCGVIFGRR